MPQQLSRLWSVAVEADGRVFPVGKNGLRSAVTVQRTLAERDAERVNDKRKSLKDMNIGFGTVRANWISLGGNSSMAV